MTAFTFIQSLCSSKQGTRAEIKKWKSSSHLQWTLSYFHLWATHINRSKELKDNRDHKTTDRMSLSWLCEDQTSTSTMLETLSAEWFDTEYDVIIFFALFCSIRIYRKALSSKCWWPVFWETKTHHYACLIIPLRSHALSWFSQNLPQAWKRCRYRHTTAHKSTVDNHILPTNFSNADFCNCTSETDKDHPKLWLFLFRSQNLAKNSAITFLVHLLVAGWSGLVITRLAAV